MDFSDTELAARGTMDDLTGEGWEALEQTQEKRKRVEQLRSRIIEYEIELFYRINGIDKTDLTEADKEPHRTRAESSYPSAEIVANSWGSCPYSPFRPQENSIVGFNLRLLNVAFKRGFDGQVRMQDFLVLQKELIEEIGRRDAINLLSRYEEDPRYRKESREIARNYVDYIFDHTS